MADDQPGNTLQPDNTAVRVALWRALHLEVDAMPHVLEDTVGLQLAAPPDGWRTRPDMHPQFTAGFRASIVARARFIEDLVEQRVVAGDGARVVQYVVLGAGLDTFAQRRADLGGQVRVFEVDQPGTQEWKRKRLAELGYDVPGWLRFAPSNFEGGSWWADLLAAGFNPALPAIVASTGVSMYLTKEANAATLRQLPESLAPGSTLAMSFLLPLELVAAEDQEGLIISQRGAAASGTPFLSFFTPSQMMELARSAGFREVRHVSSADQNARYFAARGDGLRSSTGEDLLIATT
jgi:methyltransferase (TIGR00027 family)